VFPLLSEPRLCNEHQREKLVQRELRWCERRTPVSLYSSCLQLTLITVVVLVVTHVMINVPTTEFQKLWSSLTEYLRSEYENTIQQRRDADTVMESVRGVLNALARLSGCTPESVDENSKWTPIVQNMAEKMRNLC
jgi:hypothetical protein